MIKKIVKSRCYSIRNYQETNRGAQILALKADIQKLLNSR